MTITQTLSGLWLDSEKKGEEAGLVTVLPEKDGPRLQWLLNGFLFVNVLHLAAIRGLDYLNRKKQSAREEGEVQCEWEDEDEESRGASGSVSGIDGASSPPQSPTDRTPAGYHASSPLLNHKSASPTHETHPRPRQSQQVTTLMGATTPMEVRRGKLFALLSVATVIFAWALFLITSFIKIRSRREREGHL